MARLPVSPRGTRGGPVVSAARPTLLADGDDPEPPLLRRLIVRRGLILVLVAAAVVAACTTAGLILRLPDPPVRGEPNWGDEARYGIYTERNAERRNEYLGAGGIVVATLLGAAFLISPRKE